MVKIVDVDHGKEDNQGYTHLDLMAVR